MYKWYDDLMPIVFFIVLILSLVAIAGFLGSSECRTKAEFLGVEYDYKFFSLVSCRVFVDGRIIPIDNYRVTECTYD